MVKIFTVNDFNGDSDMYGGSVATDVPNVHLEVALDTSDDLLLIRSVETDRINFRKCVTTTRFERVRIDELIEILQHIREGQREVAMMKKLAGK